MMENPFQNEPHEVWKVSSNVLFDFVSFERRNRVIVLQN